MPVETNNKRQIKPPKVKQFGGSFLILLTLLLLLNFIVPSFFGPRSPQVPYSDFIAQVEAAKVDRAIVGSDSSIDRAIVFLALLNQGMNLVG